MRNDSYSFEKARPVWAMGEDLTMNYTMSLRAEPEGGHQTMLRLAASTLYIVRLNGELLAHGPARCAHGYFYVDELDLTDRLHEGKNILSVRVVGYNVNSYAYLDQPSFICAELVSDGRVLYATGTTPEFTAYHTNERVMRTQRYSFQRAFSEVYRLSSGAFACETDSVSDAEQITLAPVSEKSFLKREIPYGDYQPLYPACAYRRGHIEAKDREAYYDVFFFNDIHETYKGYLPETLEVASHRDVGRIEYVTEERMDMQDVSVIELNADTYIDLRFEKNYAGLFELELETEGGKFYILFDELLEEGDLHPLRLNTTSFVEFIAEAGTYKLLCTEPYVLKYARLVAEGGAVCIRNLCLREISYPKSRITCRLETEDEVMRTIYDAAVETFAANTVDIYMDCPSRERAGWLCDSFFTSRIEYLLTGNSAVERAFLRNFLLPDRFAYLPEGMLPMCYPSDHYNGSYIPNWAMWYGLELYEYATRRNGESALIEEAREKMYALIRYFEGFENELGLLEKLDSWVFVEWSKANELVQDVSFASNMLYARFLSDMGNLYGDEALLAKAARLRQAILDMSMTASGFFCDNAIRTEKGLVPSGECTEACQYYAFFCDVATPESHPGLWKTLVKEFGYDRHTTGKYPEIYFANAFIGNYLRLELLSRYGYHTELYDNIRGYFAYMAEHTGTLWEHIDTRASCNHGFASHVIYWMDILHLISA